MIIATVYIFYRNVKILWYMLNTEWRFIMSKILKKIIAVFISVVLITVTVSCSNEEATENPELLIGNEGFDFALKLARDFPFRSAYSEQERQAGDFIRRELIKLGFDPIVDTFSSEDEAQGDITDNDEDDSDDAPKLTSANIYVKIPGTGFVITDDSEDESSETEPEKIYKQIIICAHYDTSFGIEQSEDYPDFDGINDNASGVGALMSVAAHLINTQMEYDIILVFFGASKDNFAGARHFASKMTAQEIADTDVVYNVESIYAGDKLYANAGINSVEPGMKYLRRRKLYEISDVAIVHRIDLRFNQSDLDVDVNGDGEKNVYREITKTLSNHSVFDEMGIPCVFIESFEYFGPSLDDHKESRNPFFSESNGMIRGTGNDSYAKLSEIFEEDRLINRIKNTAFLLIKAIEKGIYLEHHIS